jgi:Tol biopolymer transport system component
MAPDGGAPRRLADGGNAAWLPDSRRLVFIRGREYHLLDVTTGVEEPLVIDGPEPMPIFTVSPDGAWLVYQTSERGDVDLAVAPISGGRARTLLRTEREDYHPMFSPSGRWLYYQPDHRNLWRIPGPEQGWRVAPPEQVTRFPESGLYLEDPQLSRDGRQFFYSRIQTTADLWVVDLKPARP